MLYCPFIEPDTRMVKNRKAFKRFFSALSALDKTIYKLSPDMYIHSYIHIIVKLFEYAIKIYS